jgi:predicted RNA-binding protein
MKQFKIKNPPKILDKDYIGINGVGLAQLKHPHFEIWQEYLVNNYELKKEIIIFIPCAAIKPYKNSPIHKEFNKVINKFQNVQKIVISNAGLIPYEFCDEYPFNSYDWNPLFENAKIKELYIKITSKRIYDFFRNKLINKNSYKFISYLRNKSESLKALKIAFNKLKLSLNIIKIAGELHETADHDLLLILEENLERLKNALIKYQ